MRRKDRQITAKEEIATILREADACRIGFAVDNIPYIVCLNYGFEWEGELPVLYFHCAHEGKKLESMRRNNYVCFQLDCNHQLHYNPETVYCTMDYASVVGMGHLELVEEESERIKGLDLLMRHHHDEAPHHYPEGSLNRTTILRLRVTELTAKKK
ncbi:pyridoxamine 5'-phosphate oxidase family protein [Parabacteroides sp. OttesenSCG-928-N08]|nr:pyridoxamine 5'-phosphate oxidase family protein [Parabacteroides sp. OttesenSCG-928-N08]